LPTERVDPTSRDIRELYNKVRISYLSARERPKDYRDEWESTLETLRGRWDSPSDLGDILRDKMEENLLYSDAVKDPKGAKAKRVYETMKNLKNDSSLTNDPFRKKFGEKITEKLVNDKTVLAMFLHWAYRAGRGALDTWEDKVDIPDNFTEGYVGLDLTDREIYDWVKTNYGEDVDIKRLKTKLPAARELLYEVYTTEHTPQEWNELIDSKRVLKEDKGTKNNFIVPNKPMYRIFEIDDIKELKGFTGEWVVQEKYDGMRIQIHKTDTIKVYSFNNRDITSKFDKQIKILDNEKFPKCILDGEVTLYNQDEPLHRADTIAFINSEKGDKQYELKVNVFDIMKLEGEDVWNEKLEDRLTRLMNNFSAHSDEYLRFPNKSNTRFADSLEEIEEYSKTIMKNPTSEGVVIKDAKSSYVVGKKKNPKWIKWKKFVDLDLIVLSTRENKNGTFSYSLGAGPVDNEDYKPLVEVDGKKYLSVGKALNTKTEVKDGSIIRVKVDEVKKTANGFSIYSAKFIEKPEVTEAEKIITLEFLSKDNKKSAKDYAIEALEKGYKLSDGVHGDTILKTSIETDGFVLSGFYENNLMSKNAIIDIDIWKDELRQAYIKDNGILYTYIQQQLIDGELKSNQLVDKIKKALPSIVNRLFSDTKNIEKSLSRMIMEKGPAYGINYNKNRDSFSYDEKVLVKDEEPIIKVDENTYEVWKRDDGDLNFIFNYKDKEMSWRIEQSETEDLYELFGKAGKYRAQLENEIDKNKLLDKGTIKLGSQRDGYHEYLLDGKLYSGKFHFRVVPIDGQKTWIAWTGYETKPTDKDSDEGMWNIEQDENKSLKYTE
tara:strand:- start:1417 stop:3906 length:2490 start_codon:yes stop_codon:yes gene_type:complete